MPLLISKEETDMMSSGDDYDAENMFTEMLEDVHDNISVSSERK